MLIVDSVSSATTVRPVDSTSRNSSLQLLFDVLTERNSKDKHFTEFNLENQNDPKRHSAEDLEKNGGKSKLPSKKLRKTIMEGKSVIKSEYLKKQNSTSNGSEIKVNQSDVIKFFSYELLQTLIGEDPGTKMSGKVWYQKHRTLNTYFRRNLSQNKKQ